MRVEIEKDKSHPRDFVARCYRDPDPRPFATLSQSIGWVSRVWEEPQIDWSAFGMVGIGDAKEFAEGITALIELSKTLDERTGKP